MYLSVMWFLCGFSWDCSNKVFIIIIIVFIIIIIIIIIGIVILY